MAGQLTIDTLKASSGVLATQNGMTGIAKAWVRASVSGTTVTVNNSFNISSITRTAKGSYTFTMTTAMPSASYAVVSNGSTETSNVYPASSYTDPAVTATTTQFGCYWFTGGLSGGQDPQIIGVAVFA